MKRREFLKKIAIFGAVSVFGSSAFSKNLSNLQGENMQNSSNLVPNFILNNGVKS